MTVLLSFQLSFAGFYISIWEYNHLLNGGAMSFGMVVVTLEIARLYMCQDINEGGLLRPPSSLLSHSIEGDHFGT